MARVVIFNDRVADVAERFLRKGSKIYVEGALQTRKWTDQSGQEKYTTEVVIGRFRGELTMLDGKGGGDQAGSGMDGPPMASRSAAPRAARAPASSGGAAARPGIAQSRRRPRR